MGETPHTGVEEGEGMMCEVRRLSAGGPAPEDSPDSRKVPMEAEQPRDPCAGTGKGRAGLGVLLRRGICELPSGATWQLAQSPVC